MIDQGDITALAASHNIPPAILYAVSQQGNDFGMSSGVTAQYGLTPAELSGDPQLVAEIAARTLEAGFLQYGSWDQALSAYKTGDPSAFQNPMSGVGGFVESVLGQAGNNAQYGMNGFQPSSADAFRKSAEDFSLHMASHASSGGTITQDSVGAYKNSVGKFGSSSGSSTGFGVTGRTLSSGKNDLGFDFQAMPFDPQYFKQAPTESYGDQSGPGGFAEMGNDYGFGNSSVPITAPVGGKVHVDHQGSSGTGLTVFITQPGVPGRVYIGHLGSTSLKEGDTVQPGQQIAMSGGRPGVDPEPGNSTGGHIEIGYIDAQGKTHDPRPAMVQANSRSQIWKAVQDTFKGESPAKQAQMYKLAVATAKQESGLDPESIGDGGHSFGLFQLNDQGELGSMAPQQAKDPYTNAMRALQQFKQVDQQNPGMLQSNPGQLAVMAQRPSEDVRPQYIANVNAGLGAITAPFGAPDTPVPTPTPPTSQQQQTPSPSGPSTTATGPKLGDKAATGQELTNFVNQNQVPIKDASPTPKQIGEFAQQMQGMQIDPDHFGENYPMISALYWKTLHRAPTLSDFQHMKDMGPQQMVDYVKSLPHPIYPDLTAGAYDAAQNMASLFSIPMAKRTPHPAEVQRLASSGAGWKEMKDFYTTVSQAVQGGVQGGVQATQARGQAVQAGSQAIQQAMTKIPFMGGSR